MAEMTGSGGAMTKPAVQATTQKPMQMGTPSPMRKPYQMPSNPYLPNNGNPRGANNMPGPRPQGGGTYQDYVNNYRPEPRDPGRMYTADVQPGRDVPYSEEEWNRMQQGQQGGGYFMPPNMGDLNSGVGIGNDPDARMRQLYNLLNGNSNTANPYYGVMNPQPRGTGRTRESWLAERSRVTGSGNPAGQMGIGDFERNQIGGQIDPRLLGYGGVGQTPNRPGNANYYGGQSGGAGRYRPPTMDSRGGWNDYGGYNYNLPNAFGSYPGYGQGNPYSFNFGPGYEGLYGPFGG